MAVDFVTAKDKIAWAPHSHQAITKSVGGFLAASWECSNSGDGAGQAQLKLFVGTEPLRTGPLVNVPAGAGVGGNLTQLVTLLYEPIPPGFSGETLGLDLKMVDGAGTVIGTHALSLTVLPL